MQVVERRDLAFTLSLSPFPYLIIPGSSPEAELFVPVALRELLPVDLFSLVGPEEFERRASVRQPQAKTERFPGKSLRPPSHHENQVAETDALDLGHGPHIEDTGLPKGR